MSREETQNGTVLSDFTQCGVLAEFCVMLDRFAKEASRLRYLECTINRSCAWDVCVLCRK